MKTRLTLCFPIVAFALLAACGGGGSGGSKASTSGTADTSAGPKTVVVDQFKFTPANVTVKVGDNVTWQFKESTPHTATAEDKSFDSEVKKEGESYSYTFTKAGRFRYICTLHPTMKGSVTVNP